MRAPRRSSFSQKNSYIHPKYHISEVSVTKKFRETAVCLECLVSVIKNLPSSCRRLRSVRTVRTVVVSSLILLSSLLHQAVGQLALATTKAPRSCLWFSKFAQVPIELPRRHSVRSGGLFRSSLCTWDE